MTNPKLKKIDDQIQDLRKAGVRLYQYGTPFERGGIVFLGLFVGLIGWAVGKFL